MSAYPTTLSPEEIARFEADGFVVIKGAFSPDDAAEMRREWWAELEKVHGIREHDRSTWFQPLPDLKAAKFGTVGAKLGSARLRGAIDDLVGAGAWPEPKHWGRVLTTFPQAGVWDVPTKLWHSDSPSSWHRERMNGVMLFSFVGDVRPGGGGTLILAGSPRLLALRDRELRRQDPGADAARDRDRFYRWAPWLRALSGADPSPPDRPLSFMREGAEIEGVPVRVVELTGEPGDVVACHPTIAHCVSPNCGEAPRFMRIAQILTRDVARFRGGRAAS